MILAESKEERVVLQLPDSQAEGKVAGELLPADGCGHPAGGPYRVSDGGLQRCVLLLLTADVIEGEEDVVVV